MIASAKTAQGLSIMQPGKDAVEHTDKMQQGIADTLTSITGGPVIQKHVTPIGDQSVVLEDLQQTDTGAGIIGNIMTGVKGGDGVEPSKNFLNTLIDRLRRKHPTKDIMERGE